MLMNSVNKQKNSWNWFHEKKLWKLLVTLIFPLLRSTVGKKIKKSPGQKNSSNEMNQFDGFFLWICNCIFHFVRVKFKFLWKILIIFFCEIDLFDFTSFLGFYFFKFSDMPAVMLVAWIFPFLRKAILIAKNSWNWFHGKNSYFAFTRHESTTCLIPGIVIEVSAIFVAKTIFLHPSLVRAKIPFWTVTCWAAYNVLTCK